MCDYQVHEGRRVGGITPPQRRLLLYSPKPFESQLLDEDWRARKSSGDKIQYGAEMTDHGSVQHVTIVLYPCLSLDCAQGDNHEVGTAAVDPLYYIWIAHLLDGTETRRCETH